MQYLIITGSHGRVLVEQDSSGETTSTMRICSEDQINSMSAGSFKLYRNKVFEWRDAVHEHGTPEAIRTIDFLAAACGRSKRQRRELPVC